MPEVGIERAALYFIDPLERFLPELVDFDLVNEGTPRFTLGLVDVDAARSLFRQQARTRWHRVICLGSSRHFRRRFRRSVSTAILLDVGGYSNTPIEVVFDEDPTEKLGRLRSANLALARAGAGSLVQVFMRKKTSVRQPRQGSHYASRCSFTCNAPHHPASCVSLLPEERKSSPRRKELAGWGCTAAMHLIEINAEEPIDGETNAPRL